MARDSLADTWIFRDAEPWGDLAIQPEIENRTLWDSVKSSSVREKSLLYLNSPDTFC